MAVRHANAQVTWQGGGVRPGGGGRNAPAAVPVVIIQRQIRVREQVLREPALRDRGRAGGHARAPLVEPDQEPAALRLFLLLILILLGHMADISGSLFAPSFHHPWH